MVDWLLTWKALVTGAVVLLGVVVLAVIFREGTLGNVASIVGLAVSVLGFVVTVWTVLDARQQIKDAGDRADQARVQATEQIRRTLDGMATQLRATDCAALRHSMEDLRRAAQETQWLWAIFRCQEAGILVYRLAADQHLNSDEAATLRTGADDLRFIHRFIERNRMAGQTGTLQDRHLKALDRMIATLAQLQARLHHDGLRPVQ